MYPRKPVRFKDLRLYFSCAYKNVNFQTSIGGTILKINSYKYILFIVNFQQCSWNKEHRRSRFYWLIDIAMTNQRLYISCDVP